eukprot:4062493-Pleurochrysis_carterae.AAC.1
MECHEYSHGTTAFNKHKSKWETSVLTRETSKRWRDNMHSFVRYAESDWDRASAQALKHEKQSSTKEAVHWWLMMFPL